MQFTLTFSVRVSLGFKRGQNHTFPYATDSPKPAVTRSTIGAEPGLTNTLGMTGNGSDLCTAGPS